ncbi:MAG: ATP-binding cassette domain-containing protein [Coriobacteriia bacterium]|nr:ATP-binding cassette domain-containing protein [Coriobacteriia bacterium]MCL2137075.1 ATP-binding cassette domain-containing protein [Coriobacteriia bacterium]
MQLVLEQLGYRYPASANDQYALSDIDLSIGDGDFIGIIGHSGSGKSTLAQLAAGLVQPSKGRVLLDGEDLAKPKNRQGLFTRIGLAFQYPESQLFAPTVYDDIAFAARNAGFSDHDTDKRVRHWMEAFDLDFTRYAQRSPFELSGGEQRRVALAGILLVEPDILILDEPSAGLDPAGRRKLMGLIQTYHASGKIVVMVSHSMEDIAYLTNRILVLNEGRIFFQGSPEEVFAHADELEAIKLGVPKPEAFAASLRQAGLGLPPSLLSVESLALAIAGLKGKPPAGGPDE